MGGGASAPAKRRLDTFAADLSGAYDAAEKGVHVPLSVQRCIRPAKLGREACGGSITDSPTPRLTALVFGDTSSVGGHTALASPLRLEEGMREGQLEAIFDGCDCQGSGMLCVETYSKLWAQPLDHVVRARFDQMGESLQVSSASIKACISCVPICTVCGVCTETPGLDRCTSALAMARLLQVTHTTLVPSCFILGQPGSVHQIPP